MRPFSLRARANGAPRSARSRTRGRQRRVAQGTALSLMAATLVVLAVAYDGSPIRDVDLNDGSVWVSNGNRGLLGRLNSQVEELDLSLVSSATSDAIFQQGSSVQVYDDGGAPSSETRSVTMVNPISGTSLPVPLSGAYEVSSGGGMIVILDDTSGRVWIRRADQFEAFDPSEPATTQVSERSSATVTQRGTALVADRESGAITPWRFDETGAPIAGDSIEIGTTLLDDAALTAVGEDPVVLQGGKLYRPGVDPVAVAGESPSLQQVGPESSYVYLATADGLWRGELDGVGIDRVGNLEVGGAPADPVVVGDCVHGAWNDPGADNYLRSCGDDVFTGEVTGLSDASVLVFRSNRDVVVLNDSVGGASWLVQEPGLTRVDNWDSVDPNADDPQVAEADDESRASNRNKPPTAVDDRFGARPGATVILPVTLNDIDPDGDVLVLTAPPSAQGDTTFSVVGDGTQVQAKVAPDASGEVRFTYEISDGQPGNPPSEATVTVTVVKAGTDTAPGLIKDQVNELTVADGYQASVNVLPAWIDPEGDAVVLAGATSEDGTVGFRPDGTIDFTDDGAGPGEEMVEFTVRGGGQTRKGFLAVTVVDEDKAEPTTVADHFSGTAGSVVLLDPLDNDIDPLGGQLALSTLTNVSERGVQLTRDGARGTGTFTATQPGAYYLTYEATASNGVPADPQTIRVDVVAPTGDNRPPVATRDVAAVRAGGSTLVDVLANDSDPDGDVLVVQGVVVPPEHAGQVKASLINKRFVRVELDGAITGASEPMVEYLLSDGRSGQVSGAVAVTVGESGQNRTPVVVEDLVTARAGTVIDIPVLDNDKDPDGDRMTVGQQDLYDIGTSTVIADRKIPVVATGSTIRVLVPDDGTTQLQFGYGVRDAGQAKGSSRVVLNINPDDPKVNQKPQPRPIEDRTVTGQRIRVAVDTFGADPDGDPIVFTGVLQPPRLGRIVGSGSDWFDYEPIDDGRRTGTDSFKVQVSDQYGLSGVADVRIGVAAPTEENQAPSALNDELLVKPDLTIQYPVLRNDSDPDGDALILEEDLVTQEGTTARLVDTFIEVETPRLANRNEAVQAIQYAVSDGLGATSSAVYTVTVREDAPDYAPTTQDDVVTVDQLRDKVAGDQVDVDVLVNDGDLDGARENLELAPVRPDEASVVDRKLRVTLRPENQLVPYRVTDATDQSSFGFVYVSGTQTMAPMLDTTAVPLEVVAGKPLTIDLDQVVVVRPGRTPRIGNTTLISESNGDATPRGKARLEFRAPADFYGTASVTLPVIDGVDLQDPEGLESQITIPITVLPAENVPPSVRDAAVTVYAGGDPAVLLLGRLASDPNRDDELTFEVTGATGAVTAKVAGDTLAIGAGEDAPDADLVITVAASDGTASPVEGQVRVTVVGVPRGPDEEVEPPREPMTLRDLSVPDASAGERVTVDVRDAVLFDPYPGEPKEIQSVSATGPAQVSGDGTTVTIVPDEDGEVLVTYLLSDGSGDAARAVQGRIGVTVAAPPDRPSAPRAVEGGPDSVQLTWTEPPNNGSEITEYLVEWDGGSQSCPQPQCLVPDLEPGEPYRFTVTAINAEGPSEPSPQSEAVTPDTVPDTMAAPTISQDFTARDGELVLSWVEPDNEGSEIDHYEIESFPQVAIKAPRYGETTLTVTGLTNGTGYRFKIRAVNERDAGPWSPLSSEETPFTLPDAMPAPTLTSDNDNGDQKGYVTVDWAPVTAPADGHDQITGYTVLLLRDGAALTEVAVGSDLTERSFDVENGHSYSAQVKATNRAGTGGYSPVSNAEISWDRAQAVTGISNADDCPGGTCNDSTSSYVGKVRFTTPQDNGGYPVTSYTWSTEDGRSGTVDGLATGEGVQVDFNLTFASNQGDQQVTLVPITTVEGQGAVEGTSASGGSFNPYARPFPPGHTCAEAQYRAVRICWNGGDGNGRGISATRYRGDASGDRGNGGDVTIGTDQGGATRCVQVSAQNAAGLWSDWTGNMCATSQNKTVSMSVYAVSGDPGGPCSSNCDAIRVDIAGYKTSTRYGYSTNIKASDTGQVVGGTIDTNGDGRAGKVVGYYDRTAYDEEYCVTVDGVQGCVQGH